MRQLNRSVVVIKPKQPFLEWVNSCDPTLSPPVTMEDLHRDCTVILVPNLDYLEEMAAYLEPLKPRLFKMELESWYLDPALWPPNRTNEMFDEWFASETHSTVLDAARNPLVREPVFRLRYTPAQGEPE